MAVQRFGDYVYLETSSTTTSNEASAYSRACLEWSHQVRAIIRENPKAQLVNRLVPRQGGVGADIEIVLVYPKTGNRVPLPPRPR